MTDPNNPSDNPGVPDDDVQTSGGANKGQVHGGQRNGRTADLQHNQATAVRSSGDQNPSDTYPSDRDRRDTPGTNPG